MTIDFSRRALASPSGADALSLPLTLGQRGIAVFVTVSEIVEQVFFCAHRQAIHDRVDSRYAARDDYRLLRLVLSIDPAGELDNSLVYRTDIDGALAQGGVVAESFEHPLLELLGRVELLVTLLIFEIIVSFIIEAMVVGRVAHALIAFVFILGCAIADLAEPVANFRGETAESAVLLCYDDTSRKSGESAERNVKRTGRGGFFVAISERRHVLEPVA